MANEIPAQATLDVKAAKKRISQEAGEQQATIFKFIGGLMTAWATAETSLIAILERVAGLNSDNAVIIFYSHTSSNSKIDLLRSLALLNLKGEELSNCLDLLRLFSNRTKIRNELAHAEYALNSEYFYEGTYSTNIRDTREGNLPQLFKPFDKARINEIRDAANSINQIGSDIYKWCVAFDQARKA